MTDAVRLSKRVAELRACSRREAELLIEGGWVRVAGRVVEQPQSRVDAEPVEIDPQARPAPVLPVTLLLHKPPGCDWRDDARRPAAALLTPQNHWPGDRTPQRILQRHLAGQRSITPLEPAASGLLVYSQERPVLRKLLEEPALVEFELIAEVREKVTDDALALLRRAPVVDGRAMLPAKVSLTGDAGAGSRLRFAIKGCHPGQVASMCAAAGLTLTALRRIRIGRVPLAALPPGQWRYLSLGERI